MQPLVIHQNIERNLQCIFIDTTINGRALLAMLGLEGDDHFVGRDILKTPPEEGRALLSTYQNLGYMKGNVMTVLQPKRKIETFRISADGKEAQLIATEPKMAEEAIAYFQGAALLMEQHGADGKGKSDG